MPDAVIVAAARTPIGRAYKGTLRDLRPDDLAVRAVRAALAQVPSLDPCDIDDLLLGCGSPGGEQGFNVGRVVFEKGVHVLIEAWPGVLAQQPGARLVSEHGAQHGADHAGAECAVGDRPHRADQRSGEPTRDEPADE